MSKPIEPIYKAIAAKVAMIRGRIVSAAANHGHITHGSDIVDRAGKFVPEEIKFADDDDMPNVNPYMICPVHGVEQHACPCPRWQLPL